MNETTIMVARSIAEWWPDGAIAFIWIAAYAHIYNGVFYDACVALVWGVALRNNEPRLDA